MTTDMRKTDLSEPRKRFLELMQDINFGWIERLQLQDGDPMFDPAPRVVREHKFGGENGPRKEKAIHDYALKRQVRELLEYFDEIRNGTIERIEVQRGLPFRMNVEGRIPA